MAEKHGSKNVRKQFFLTFNILKRGIFALIINFDADKRVIVEISRNIISNIKYLFSAVPDNCNQIKKVQDVNPNPRPMEREALRKILNMPIFILRPDNV